MSKRMLPLSTGAAAAQAVWAVQTAATAAACGTAAGLPDSAAADAVGGGHAWADQPEAAGTRPLPVDPAHCLDMALGLRE